MTSLLVKFRDPRWRYARMGLFILLIAFIAVAVLKRLSANYDDLEGQSFIAGWRGAFAVAAFCVAVLVSGVLWRSLVRALVDHPIPLGSSVRAHVAAWLLKYIPGQVGAFAWKIAWGPKVGVSKSQASVAFLYENLFLGITSTVPTILILLIALGSGAANLGWYLVAGVAVAVGFVLLSYGPVLRRLIRLILRVTKRKVDPDQLTFIGVGDALRLQVLYVVPRLINGIGFVVLVGAVHHVTARDAVVLVAAYTLAGILGILAVFVPSGIGVREAVIVLICSRLMSVELATVVAINARIWATASDAVLGVGYLIRRKRSQEAA